MQTITVATSEGSASVPVDRLSLALVRAHLRMLSVGMKHSRMPGTKVLAMASKLTGTAYKRGQYARALTDVQAAIAAWDAR